MSCILTSGRTTPCLNNIGGIKKVHLFPFVKYSYSQIIGVRGVNITEFPVDTTIYTYEIQSGNFNETINNDETGIFYEQNLTFTLTKQELAVTNELASAEKIDLSYIVEYNDGSLKVGGLWNGARLSFDIQSGGSKSDFNGYNVTITGRELYQAAYISDLTVITGGTIPNLILDDYTGAYFGLSLRKLRNAYSGSAIRVRRSSDNAETDIGFSGNDFDLSALTTFVGAGNGFVTTWYGQDITGRDFTQSTPSNQPQIVTSGTVSTLNGEPIIPFTSTRYLQHTLNITDWATADLTCAWVGQHSGLGRLNTAVGSSGLYFFARAASSYAFRKNATVAALTPRPTNLTEYVVNMFHDHSLSTVSHYFDNVLQDTNTLDGNWNNTSFCIGGDGNTFCKEYIMYDSDNTSNLSGINTNINNYYSVY